MTDPSRQVTPQTEAMRRGIAFHKHIQARQRAMRRTFKGIMTRDQAEILAGIGQRRRDAILRGERAK